MLAVATLIGDVVASKGHPDRSRLHSLLQDCFREINRILRPRQPLVSTIGDEFQGAFTTIEAAARASLLVRLRLLEVGVDTRYGLGYGPIELLDAKRSPVTQDGPGWWAARLSIEEAKELGDASRTSFARTVFHSSRGTGEGDTESKALSAFLLCRDGIVAQMKERHRTELLGLMLGRTQADLASALGVTQGAVSQTLMRSGAYAIEAAHNWLMSDGTS